MDFDNRKVYGDTSITDGLFREGTILGQSMMMVPMVIAMPVVVMVMLKSVQLKTTPRKRKGFGP